MSVTYSRVAQPHASTHREIIGTDELVDHGLFERIGRVRSTIHGSARTFFGGTANVESTLRSGHTWAISGHDAASNLNDTGAPVPPNGSQAIKIVTNGAGTAAFVTAPRITATNMANKFLVFQIRVDGTNFASLSQVQVYIGSGAGAFTNFATQTIASYNGTNADFTELLRPDEWVTVSMPVAAFASSVTGTVDWANIRDVRIRVIDRNTGPKVTAWIGGAWIAAGDSAYASGVVSLSFDDQWDSVWTYAVPKLGQYGYRGSVFRINDLVGAGGYMTRAQLTTLRESGWEINAHAGLVANHNFGSTGASDSLVSFVGLDNTTVLSDWGALKGGMHRDGDRGVDLIAWPRGAFDSTVLTLGRQQWAAARTVCFRNVATVPVAEPLRIPARSIAYSTAFTPAATLGTIHWYVDQINTYGGWLNLVFHRIVTASTANSGIEVNNATFDTFIDYLAGKTGLKVLPVGEVLGL